jgi:hypothetical protein
LRLSMVNAVAYFLASRNDQRRTVKVGHTD